MPALIVQAARLARGRCSEVKVKVFSDRDIASQRSKIEAALAEADVFFGSLLFDYDQVSCSTLKPNTSIVSRDCLLFVWRMSSVWEHIRARCAARNRSPRVQRKLWAICTARQQ